MFNRVCQKCGATRLVESPMHLLGACPVCGSHFTSHTSKEEAPAVDPIDSITTRLLDNAPEYIEGIVEEAHKRFILCEAEDDFGLQYAGPTSIVFGRTNRVIWRPSGFRLDRSYCTPNFIEKWETIYGC